MTELVLANVRMPGDAALYGVHISAGHVSRIGAADQALVPHVSSTWTAAA